MFFPSHNVEAGEGSMPTTDVVEVPPHTLTASDNKVDDGGMAEVHTQEEVNEKEGNEIVTTTRPGRSVRVPKYLRENSETSYIGLSATEENYFTAMASIEFCFVSAKGVEEMMVEAGVGCGLVNINELYTSQTSSICPTIRPNYPHLLERF
jgi:hypothetical protein